jgi:hypothetical protein
MAETATLATLLTPTAVRRYVRSIDAPDATTYDIIWRDRLTGDRVLSYDGADPANTNPAYGGKSDEEYFEDRGLDIFAEIEASQSKLPVGSHEAEDWARAKAARERKRQEEEEAKDLLEFLGDAADAFDFDKYEDGEHDVLAPALEARGYTNVRFYMVEQDSFGPLIRGCVANDPSGKRVRFMYG